MSTTPDNCGCGRRGCGYHEGNRHCGAQAIYEAKIAGRDLLLCERHIRPEFWPPDLRKKLPGRLKRLAAALTQQRGGRS